METNPNINEETCAYCYQKAPVFWLMLSEDGKILDVNRYAADLTGRSLKGENVSDVIVDCFW